MRYRLSISSAEAVERIRGVLLGAVKDSRQPVWRTAAKQGFYGEASQNHFEIGWNDGIFSPHPRSLTRGMLIGTLQEDESGCTMDVRFRYGKWLWVWYGLFAIGIIVFMISFLQTPSESLFELFWSILAVLMLTGFSLVLREKRKLSIRKLEALFSYCIIEREKN